MAQRGGFFAQGLYQAGQFAATLHPEILGGGTLLAVSDSRGGVYCDSGLDPEAIVKHKIETGRVEGFPGTKPISNEDLRELNVDVLYPAALVAVILAMVQAARQS